MINEQGLDVSLSGINKTGSPLPSFLLNASIRNENTGYPTQTVALTVALLNQIVFNLGFVPAPGGIRSAVVNRKTYFEPDFTVVNQTFTWNLGVLPVGTTIAFESTGTEQEHRYKQTLPIRFTGQQSFELLTVPRGYEVEVYLNGFFYDSTSGAFRIQRNILHWSAASLTLADKLVILYARTAEGSLLYQYDNLRVNPASPSNFRLSLEVRIPTSSRLYFRGLRYFNASDYATSLDDLTVVAPLNANHGDVLTFVQATDSTYFQKVNESGRLANQVFVSTHYVVPGGHPTTLPVMNPSRKSILSVNGAMYAEGSGYSRSTNQLDWENAMLLGAGDVFSLLGFFEQPSADAVKFSNFTGVVGYPTLDLGEKAADIRKAMVFVAADGNFGGELYMGHLFLTFPTNRQITWAGAFPLKPTDIVTVVFFKDPALAANLTLETHQVTPAEDGLPFAYTLRHSPTEPSGMLIALNGACIMQPLDYIVNDNAVLYYNSSVPVKALDVVTFLYR